MKLIQNPFLPRRRNKGRNWIRRRCLQSNFCTSSQGLSTTLRHNRRSDGGPRILRQCLNNCSLYHTSNFLNKRCFFIFSATSHSNSKGLLRFVSSRARKNDQFWARERFWCDVYFFLFDCARGDMNDLRSIRRKIISNEWRASWLNLCRYKETITCLATEYLCCCHWAYHKVLATAIKTQAISKHFMLLKVEVFQGEFAICEC